MIDSLRGYQSGEMQILVREAEGIATLFQGLSNLKMRCSAKAGVKGIGSTISWGFGDGFVEDNRDRDLQLSGFML